MINLTIDGKKISVEDGTTVLRAATDNGIKIPNLCYDGRVELYGACGLCVIEAEGVPKLLRACSAKCTEGMVVRTNSERITRARKTALELLLSDHDGDCKAPCTLACPANTDCQGYVGLIANGEYNEATRLIKEKIPLPSSIGRICPHPCEKKCRRQFVDEPVSIASLKAFAADMDMASENQYVPSVEPDTGKKVAVIGGGPGGLTAAYFLRRNGHSITVFDMMPQMGGMLRYGIPEYRLPKALLDKEIEQIKALGVELQNNVKIGEDVTLDGLRKDYDAVVIAAGAWQSSKMRVSGEDLDGVIGGIDFLRNVILGNKQNIGKKVAVCGGGNTAMDACRTAVRLGAQEVTVLYRRTRDEMPAEDIEIKEAEEEGVVFKYLSSPVEFVGENGKLKYAKIQKMKLGEPDQSGRRRPEPIENAVEDVEFDTVIMAIGQYPNLKGFEGVEVTRKNTISADEESFRTSVDGVFAVGDITNKGASIAIAAIGEAQKASVIIDRYLNGENVKYKKPFRVERELPLEFFNKFPKEKRAVMPQISSDIRKNNFSEVSLGFTEEQAKKEAMRCLECGCHDFFECKLIEYANQYDVKPERVSGEKHNRNNEDVNSLISRNTDKCILCGLCVRVCEETMGKTNLGLIGRGFDTIVSPEFSLPLEESSCAFCGQCVAVCPTGALREKQPTVKRLVCEEKSTQSVCNFCNALCNIDVRSVGSTVTRVKPSGDKGILCKAGKFGIFALNTEEIKNYKFSKEDLQSAQQTVSYAAKNNTLAIVMGAQSTVEEINEALKITDNVYADLNENAAAYRAFITFGIKDIKNIDASKVILSVGSTYLPQNNETLIAVDCIKNSKADVMLYCAPFTANKGTYIDDDGVKRLCPAVESKLPKAYDILMSLCENTENSSKPLDILKVSDIIHSEIVKDYGNYMSVKDCAVIDAFLKKF